MTLLSDGNCLLHRGSPAIVVHILDHTGPIMKEIVTRDVMTDQMGAENDSKEEAKIREIASHAGVLFVPEATVQ